MNHENCKCRKCKGSLHYEMPSHIGFQIIGLKAYWCHKCDAKNYIWQWGLHPNEPLGHKNEL